MNKDRKRKLIEHLCPTVDVAKLLFEDLCVEIALLLPKKVCFSADNFNSFVREENLKTAREIVRKFLLDNVRYKIELESEYGVYNIDYLVDNVLCAYLIYLTPHINKGSGADIFLDKRSICYKRHSIIDIL